LRLRFRRKFGTGVDRLAVFEVDLNPAEDARPSLTMTAEYLYVAGESGMADTNQRAGPDFVRAGVMQAVDFTGLKFPADHGVERVGPTGFPGVDEKVRGIDLQVLAFDAEGLAIGGDAAPDPTHFPPGRRSLEDSVV
jgi:hypothetical protein